MGTKLCYGHAMSVTSYGMIEMCRGSALWIPAAKPYFYGDVNTISLLAHPWGEWTPEDDLPAPVVEPRGLPLAVMCAHSQRQETTTRLVLWFR